MLRIEKARTVLLCFAILVIFLVVGTALKDRGKKEVVPEKLQEDAASDHANIKLKNVNYNTVNENNIKMWDLKADSAMYYKDRERLLLEGVDVSFYSDGKIYRLTGNTGEYNTKTRDIEINGQVVGVLPDSTELRTETLRYNHQKRIMTTNDKISIKRGNILIDGVGVIINLEDKKMLILDKVRASQNAKKK